MTTEATLAAIYNDNLRLLEQKNYGPEYEESLLKGPWGALLYLFYYEQYADDKVRQAGTYLQQLYDALTPAPVNGYNYCTGTAGPFWLLHHLNKHQFIDIDINYLASDFISAAIIESDRHLAQQNFDFLHGSAGICNTLVPYAHQQPVQAHLQRFVDALMNISQLTAQGRSLPVFVLFETPVETGVNAFGMAHGSCCLLILLSRIYQAGIATTACKQLVYECIDYILSHQNIRKPEYPHALFPGILDGRSAFSRLSWCYGDLTVALALWHCGQCFKEDKWLRQSLDIMHYTLKRDTDETAGVVDACLCHGASGIAAFYRRFWHETNDKAFYDQATRWHRNTLNKIIFSPDAHIHGIQGWEGLDNQWEFCWDLLDGSSGVGLSLLSEGRKDPLPWDELLLLS